MTLPDTLVAPQDLLDWSSIPQASNPGFDSSQAMDSSQFFLTSQQHPSHQQLNMMMSTAAPPQDDNGVIFLYSP